MVVGGGREEPAQHMAGESGGHDFYGGMTLCVADDLVQHRSEQNATMQWDHAKRQGRGQPIDQGLNRVKCIGRPR